MIFENDITEENERYFELCVTVTRKTNQNHFVIIVGHKNELNTTIRKDDKNKLMSILRDRVIITFVS